LCAFCDLAGEGSNGSRHNYMLPAAGAN
jgi:hypothetical protein